MTLINTKIVTAVVGLVFAFSLIGCKAQQDARRIDPSSPETITTVGDLDVQDAADAAAGLAQSLLESGVLGREGRPSRIAISRYVNNTSRQIDRDEVIKKIRVTLNKAGVAQTYTTIGSTGTQAGAEDTIASAHQRQDRGDDNPLLVRPEYSLTFKILDKHARAGNIRQVTYTFQMSLTEIDTGLAVWEEERRITKQGSRPVVGW